MRLLERTEQLLPRAGASTPGGQLATICGPRAEVSGVGRAAHVPKPPVYAGGELQSSTLTAQGIQVIGPAAAFVKGQQAGEVVPQVQKPRVVQPGVPRSAA